MYRDVVGRGYKYHSPVNYMLATIEGSSDSTSGSPSEPSMVFYVKRSTD
jgi:hypothetical protein